MSGAPGGAAGGRVPGRPGGPAAGGGSEGGSRSITLSRDMLWPAAVVLFLATVVVVNLAFIYVAVSGADEVAPSYVTGER